MQLDMDMRGGGLPDANLDAGEQDTLYEGGGNDGSIGVLQPHPEPDPSPYAADTLYAIPQQTTVAIGGAVRIVVASGMPANPFQYMNSVGVTVDSGATYVDGTYNVGALGGAQRYPDGIWSTMDSVPTDFLLPTDSMICENDIDECRVRIDFNVTPLFNTFLAESRVTEGGELFNFQLEFSSAGTYTLGFEEFRDVKRTYYSDDTSAEYNWGDISNDHPNVPNSITVTSVRWLAPDEEVYSSY